MAQVQLRKLVKRYGAVTVVHGIDLYIPDGKFVALVGPSGCGKTTTLRMIAGLEDISGGQVTIGDRVVNSVAPKDRDIAMVFQSYALYPHMTVRENMSFGLKLRGIGKQEIASRLDEAARMLDIRELMDRRPKQLSGGQRQRVAMGRALVRNPQVFLFDEPLSNLDAKLRVQMRTEIKRLHQQVNTTTVYVTHDQVEAMTLADFIVVMNRGRIEQTGTPHELYHAPTTKFVAGFVGSPSMNFLPCRVEDRSGALALVLADGLSFPVSAERSARYRPFLGKEMLFGLRPEHLTEVRPAAPGETAEHATFTAQIAVVEPMGMETMVFLAIGGHEVVARVAPASAVAPGENMTLQANLAHMHLIDPATDLVV
jgi:multiple sugar transport system ATP-binding protein